MVLMCCRLLVKCGRLIIGRRDAGGLIGPRVLRLVAWLFLCIPVGSIFTGYFMTHTVTAVVRTAIYISIFCGLRKLAQVRESQAPKPRMSFDEHR